MDLTALMRKNALLDQPIVGAADKIAREFYDGEALADALATPSSIYFALANELLPLPRVDFGPIGCGFLLVPSPEDIIKAQEAAKLAMVSRVATQASYRDFRLGTSVNLEYLAMDVDQQRKGLGAIARTGIDASIAQTDKNLTTAGAK